MTKPTDNRKRDFIAKAIFVSGMLFAGSINTISKKAMNQCTATGIDGTERQFSKPWFQSLLMFSGEAVALLLYAISKCCGGGNAREHHNNNNDNTLTINYSEVRSEDEVEPLLVSDVPNKKVGWTAPFWLLIPATCDLLGTTLGGIGLLYTNASVWQMLRGSIIIFTTILSVIFLKQKKFLYHWFGIFVTTMGLGLVGAASLLSATLNNNMEKVAMGLVLIVCGQFMNAAQNIIEELFLKKKGFEPAQAVGYEGVWGIILMSAIVLPILYHVHGSDVNNTYENSLDAVYQIEHNSLLLAMAITYLLSTTFFNFFGLSVAKALSSVHRTLIDALRTTVVWVVDLFIFYVVSEDFGEDWNKYSVMQLVGFALLLTGTLIYNQVFRFKFLEPKQLP